jgi:hypothetical protein
VLQAAGQLFFAFAGYARWKRFGKAHRIRSLSVSAISRMYAWIA